MNARVSRLTPHLPERDELATLEQRLDPAAAADLTAAVTPHRRATASRMRADSPGAATRLIPRSSARTRCIALACSAAAERVAAVATRNQIDA